MLVLLYYYVLYYFSLSVLLQHANMLIVNSDYHKMTTNRLIDYSEYYLEQ